MRALSLSTAGALGLVLTLSLTGCEETRPEDARHEMLVLLRARGVLAREEVARLASYGHDALPAIEEGLATGPPGDVRLELITLLGTLGDPAAVPLLRQEVAYGPEPDSRREATEILDEWARGSDDRSAAARAAMARAAALRALEQIPAPSSQR